MKKLDEIKTLIDLHRDILADIYGIEITGVFCSYVRGEENQGSDLDLLAGILRPISLIELVGAEQYLEEVIGVKVDLVPERSLRMELRDDILREAVPI